MLEREFSTPSTGADARSAASRFRDAGPAGRDPSKRIIAKIQAAALPRKRPANRCRDRCPFSLLSRHPPSAPTTSASAQTVSGQDVNARIFSRPAEVLEIVPGLIVTQHSGDGKANQYFLRGFNLDHGTDFAIFVDDMPVNMRTHAHGQGYADLNFLIPN